MDKLTWFKFTPSNWVMGKILKCPEVTQARFIRLVCLYWNKECILHYDDAEIEVDKEHLDIMISKKVIKNIDDFIVIEFLNEQLEGISETSEKRRKAVNERWKKVKQNDTSVSKNDTSVLQNDTDKSKSRIELDKSREDEKREEKKTKENTLVNSVDLKNQPDHPKIDFNKLVSFFNANRGALPEVKKLSEARKKRIFILEKQYGKESIRIAIEKTRESEFLQGNNSNNWIASFDWIFKPANFLKILEDNYANREKPRTINTPKSDIERKQDAVNAVNAMFGIQQ